MDELDEVDDEVEREEQYFWFLLLPSLPQPIIVKLHNDYGVCWKEKFIVAQY